MHLSTHGQSCHTSLLRSVKLCVALRRPLLGPLVIGCPLLWVSPLVWAKGGFEGHGMGALLRGGGQVTRLAVLRELLRDVTVDHLASHITPVRDQTIFRANGQRVTVPQPNIRPWSASARYGERLGQIASDASRHLIRHDDKTASGMTNVRLFNKHSCHHQLLSRFSVTHPWDEDPRD